MKPADHTTTNTVTRPAYCGTSVPRVDGEEKVKGKTLYLGDLSMPGMWHGGAVRAPIARGRVRGISFAPDFDWTRVVIVKAGDIPGDNILPIIQRDMPCLAEERIAYRGEPVALVGAPTLPLLREALQAITVEVESETPLLGMDELVARYKADPGSVDILHALDIEKGDVEAGFAHAHRIVEGEYFTGPQEQAYLEPQGLIAVPRDEGVHISGSLQCPFYVRPAVACVLGLPDEAVIVEQTPMGGGFGGKEDYPSFLAAYAALLARKAGEPVRMLLDRHEDMLVTPKRHASWCRVKSGVMPDSALAALDMEILLDGGAYVTLTPVVLSRAAIHAAGPYRCDHVRIRARALRSNITPAGAFRGFGAPQVHFACESHMDEVAHALLMDPVEVRRKNVVDLEDVTATGQILKESVGARECLEAVLASCSYTELRRAVDQHNRRSRTSKRGLGVALFWHGGGFTGAGEERIAARAGLALNRDGTVEIRVSSTEMGQGSLTTLSQIVADACGIDLDRVRYALPETSRVPDSGPTVASRTTMIVGRILEDCGCALVKEMEKRLGDAVRENSGFRVAEHLTWEQAAERIVEAEPLYVERSYQRPPDLRWNEETHQGDAYATYAWGAVAVEISVDRVTSQVTPVQVWCTVDVGKAIHPQAAKGQVEGGLAQALGYALFEELTLSEEGAFQEARFQDYILPTTADMPELHVDLLEIPYSRGPSGAKGLGELPMNGLAPALGNAIRQALGFRLNHLPMTPEKIVAMERGSASHG